MPFQGTITADAEAQRRALPARQQRTLEATIITRLQDRPTTPTRAIKRLRPNPFAESELRVGAFVSCDNAAGNEVVLLVVGRKVGNNLIVGGEEFHGHQDNLPESSGHEPVGDAE